jgi:cysteine synthase
MESHLSRTLLNAFCPVVAPLTENLSAAAFPLMKIYPAELCIRQAARNGVITPQTLVVESSSGTMALGLAIVCKWYGYRLAIVTDNACDAVLCSRMAELGAIVDVVSKPAPQGGFQAARLNRLAAIRSDVKDCWWVNQYDNPSNRLAYSSLASHLADAIGHIDCVIGPVGSGGSLCGTGAVLRTIFPNLRLVAVDTFGSVLFGQRDGSRQLRGLGNSILPRNLDHSEVDEVHWVSAAEAYSATRSLHRETTMYCGGTSGGCWLVGQFWAARHPGQRVVCIFPDQGNRYTDTIYNDRYLRDHGLWMNRLPDCPIEVRHPAAAKSSWSFMDWNRRTYAEVVGRDPEELRATAEIGAAA